MIPRATWCQCGEGLLLAKAPRSMQVFAIFAAWREKSPARNLYRSHAVFFSRKGAEDAKIPRGMQGLAILAAWREKISRD